MTIFVFGSNLDGRHGKGAALDAWRHHGAIRGVGEGPQGMAYAIPTKGKTDKDGKLPILPLEAIKKHVDRFIEYAKHTDGKLRFFVTAIGTGLAGYRNEDIAPLFAEAPGNCELPYLWQKILSKRKQA